MNKFSLFFFTFFMFVICLYSQEYDPAAEYPSEPGYNSGSGSEYPSDSGSGTEYTSSSGYDSGTEYAAGPEYDPGSQLPDVDKWVKDGVDVFNAVKRDTVLKNMQMKTYFKWADSSQSVLYYVYRKKDETVGLMFENIVSERVQLVFDGNDLSSITIMAYSLNANNFMLEDEFEQKAKSIAALFPEAVSGEKPVTQVEEFAPEAKQGGRKSKAAPGVKPVQQKVKAYSKLKIKRLVWTGKELTYVLTYAGRDAKPQESVYQANFDTYANSVLKKNNKKSKKSGSKKDEKKNKSTDAGAEEEDPKEKKEREKLGKKDMFVPGFMELKIFRTPVKEKGKKSQPADKAKSGGKKNDAKYAVHVKKNDDKDVFIDRIPMVDQGDSFASCAIMERLVRYYFGEQDINPYDLQLYVKDIYEKEREKERGKDKDKKNVPLPPLKIESLQGMPENVAKALSRIFKCNVKVYYDFVPNELSNLKQIVRAYNVQAKKDQGDPVEIVKERPNFAIEGPKAVNIGATFQNMRYNIYVAMRRNEKELKDAFFKTIKEQINLGYPVVWNVNSGIMPTYDGKKPFCFVYEKYCRLIIGYNENKSLIYYSDTLGPDHEKLSIPLDDAWPLTTGYLSITPK